MLMDNLDKIKTVLTEDEFNYTVGMLARDYELLRFNGSPQNVRDIYGGGLAPQYYEEKERVFYNSGSSFATYLDDSKIGRIGKVLLSFIKENRCAQ